MIPFAGWLALTLGAPQLPVTHDTVFAGGFDGAWILGYQVGYAPAAMPNDKIAYDTMTHVVIGAVLPNADGTLNTGYYRDNPASGPSWAKEIVDGAHAAGRKALLMVGGAGTIDGFRGAASSAHRAAFVTHLLAAMDAAGADGLDLDWEPLPSSDYANFTAIAQALRTARPALVLTVPIGPINTNLTTVPDAFFGDIAPLFDRINIMTYEMAGGYEGWDSWFTSALQDQTDSTPMSVETSIDYYLASGVPRGKLGVGIGFYGMCWQGLSAPRQPVVGGAQVVGSDNTYSYHNIVTSYYSLANYHYDVAAESSYLGSATAFGPVGKKCNFLSYEDAASIAAKGAWSNRNGLGGTIIWNIGEGYVPEQVGSENALLQSVHDAFLPEQP
jgi:chitinase